MKKYVSFVDKLPWLAKLLLTLFLDPIIYGIYRIGKGKLLLGLIWIFTVGIFGIGWIFDFIQVILYKSPKYFV